MLDTDTSAITTPLASLATSKSPSSVPLTGAESLQNNTVRVHDSDVSDIPSSAFPEAKVDNILPTGSCRRLCSSMADLDLAIVFPGSHLLTNRTSPGTSSPWPTSAPELVPATGDEGSPNTGPHEDKDALDRPPGERAIQANTMTVGLLSHLPRQSVPHIAIADPSQRELDVGHTGDPVSVSRFPWSA
jgi:hypothetical protein